MQSTIRTIREAFERGEGAGLSTIIALAHFDLAEQALGRAWEALPLDAVAFKDRFPDRPRQGDPLINKFTGLRMYQNWRSATLRMIFANGGAPTEDHIESLKAYGRIAGLKSALSDLRAPLERAFGNETPPAAITSKLAVEADRQLSGIDRQRLRRALKCLDDLRKLPEVVESGLLGPEPIGPMPRYRSSGQREVPLPPLLGSFCKGVSIGMASAIKLVFEIGVDAGVLQESEDISPGHLVDPATFNALQTEVHARHKPRTAEQYLKIVSCALLGTSVSEADLDGWSKLRCEARVLAPEVDLNPQSTLKSACGGREPWELDQAWFDDASNGAETKRQRSALRSGIRVLEKLRDAGHENLLKFLPPEPIQLVALRPENLEYPSYLTGALRAWRGLEAPSAAVDKNTRNALRFLWRNTRADGLEELIEPENIDKIFSNASDLTAVVLKQYRVAAHRFREVMFREPPYEWDKLVAHARSQRFSKEDIHSLGALRSHALSGPRQLAPHMIDRDWVDALRDGITARSSTQRLRRGVSAYDVLRTDPDLKIRLSVEPLGPLADRRRLSSSRRS